MPSKYQTLSGFLLSPFNGREDLSRDTEYDTKYRQFVQSNSIKLHAMCKIDDSFYLHIKVPSESQKGNYEYDVVILEDTIYSFSLIVLALCINTLIFIIKRAT